MARYIFQGTFRDGQGNIVSGGTITVYLAGTDTFATIYEDDTTVTSTYYVTSDDNGFFVLYVDSSDYNADQLFKLQLSKQGYTTKEYDDIKIYPQISFGGTTGQVLAKASNDDNDTEWIDISGFKYLSSYSSLVSALTSIGSTTSTLVLDTTGTVSTDITIPATLAVKGTISGIITIASGKTLTINGPFEAGDYQVFGGLGSVSGLKEASPVWFGAVGDGVTDDTDAVNMGAQSVSSGGRYYFPAATSYKTTSAVSIPAGIDVVMDAPIKYVGTDNIAALTVGTNDVANTCRTLDLDVIRDTQSDWTSEDCIGIVLTNIHTSSSVRIKRVSGFTIGTRIWSQSGSYGALYNAITLGLIYNNKIGLDVYSTPAGGAVNENVFVGGRFAIASGTNTGTARYGVRISSAAGHYNNNNIFYKPSFELDGSHTAEETIPILIEYGWQNAFYDVRSEGNDTTLAKITNNSQYNVFELGYDTGVLDDQSTYPVNLIRTRRTIAALDNLKYTVFNSGPVARKAAPYRTSGAYKYVHIAGLFVINSSGGTPTSNTEIGNGYINQESTYSYLTLPSPYGVGIKIDTTTAKKFYIEADAANSTGRIGIICYDASGTRLTSAGADHPYVQTTSANGVAWSASYGGIYKKAADGTYLYFQVKSAVKSIAVFITGSTTALQLKSFIVKADYPATTFLPYNEPFPNAHLATAAPTHMIQPVGRSILNATPSSGNPMGWVCVNQKNTTVNGDEATGQVVITVTDAATISDGDIIGIMLDSGACHWTTVNGAPVANDVTISVALPSQASSGAVVYTNDWLSMPNL